IIDEAHMYRGAWGGEVALLLRRLFYKLGISRDKVQFILTTASMPNDSVEDENSVKTFARQLTASENDEFHYMYGDIVRKPMVMTRFISMDKLLQWNADEPLGSLNGVFSD